MTDQDITDTLRKAFATYTEAERANVRKHLAKGVRVLCGQQSRLFHSKDGGL